MKEPSYIRVDGDTAFVSLGRELEAMIDLSDVPLVSDVRWTAQIGKWGHAYAATSQNGRAILMHRLLLKAAKGVQVDHADGDGLNNRRSNIRLATSSQNMANRVADRRNKLGIKGVRLEYGRYRACISPNGKTIRLGAYDTPAEAAAAYNGAAIILWGEFARQK